MNEIFFSELTDRNTIRKRIYSRTGSSRLIRRIALKDFRKSKEKPVKQIKPYKHPHFIEHNIWTDGTEYYLRNLLLDAKIFMIKKMIEK